MFKLKLFLLFFFFTTSCFANIEFIVHHNPGGPSDKITRIIAETLPKEYTVVNRPGAQGKIAVQKLLNSKSLLIATMTQIFVSNMLDTNPTYIDDDLELIALVGHMPNVLLCNKKHSFNSYQDFINTKKSLNFGVAGYGSSEHISTEILLKQHYNLHKIIPYALGGGASLIDLLSGNIDCMFANYPLVLNYINDHRLNVLLTSHNLISNIPYWDLIYYNEFPIKNLLGIIVNKNLNFKIKQKIKNDLIISFKNENVIKNIKNIGVFPIISTDQHLLNNAIKNNDEIKKFIIKNNIKIK